MNTEYKKAVAAGGVIVKSVDGVPKVLVMVTKDENKGFLPKGHVEEGETLEEAALREIHEEAGLKQLKIIEKIGVYERRVEKKKEDKTIHMFLMVPTVENEEHFPLEESSNINFNWCSLDNLPEMYLEENKDVIERNKEKIKALFNLFSDTNN